ncbi:MAG: carboxypeptidase-like regulatory domain-containing protein [Planctomycetaceae bacterium]
MRPALRAQRISCDGSSVIFHRDAAHSGSRNPNAHHQEGFVMWNSHFRQRIMVALTLVWFSGCSSESVPNWPEPVSCSGTVTMNGESLSNATVLFIPEAGTVGPGGSGTTDETGKYSVQSLGPDKKMEPGLIPGKYKVAFSRMVKPDGQVWVPEPNSTEGPATSGAREELPQRYSMPFQSKIVVEVTDKSSPHDFKLKKK